MWYRLVTLSIDDRKGMAGGGEGESTKEENVVRECFPVVAMTVGGGMAVGL